MSNRSFVSDRPTVHGINCPMPWSTTSLSSIKCALISVLALNLALSMVSMSAGVQASTDTLIDTSPLPSELESSEHGQVFDEAIHILGGNVNVISQWTGEIRLVVVGDTQVDTAGGITNGVAGSSASQPSTQTSAAEVAGNVIAEVAQLTGLLIGKASDSYANAEDYLQSIRRAGRFSLSDCTDQSARVQESKDLTANNQAARDPSAVAAGRPACGNFFVVIADVAEMEAIAKAIPLRPVYQKAFANPDAIKCFFSPFQTGYMEIKQALVFVRRDLSRAMVRTCLQEEIYQSFGMFNDFTGSRYYSFNNKIAPKVITRYDRALLQTIYEPGFRHGAPVFVVVKKLMERLGLDPFAAEK